MNYYNENDPKAAAWLRELVARNLIPNGHVDTRSIVEVTPGDLAGFTQCHFFAGIGGWPYALGLAGWPSTRPVWTGSCPCQPFSCAGKQLGTADERHLWPVLNNLISECKPPVVFGEQVASKAGREWFSGVRTDLEALGYAVGGADLCAASVGAPHIRQRLYWLANAAGMHGSEHGDQPGEESRRRQEENHAAERGATCGLVNSFKPRLEGHAGNGDDGDQSGRFGADQVGPTSETGSVGHWETFDILHCTDGKARRIEPGSFPLAHGVPARVVRLRGYGNAIVPQLAAQFIQAAVEAITALSQKP